MDLYAKSVDSVGYDNLIAGTNINITEKSVTLQQGQGVVKRGAVLGKVTKTIGAPVPKTGNTGTGTVTDVSLGSSAKLGDYILECITAVQNGGVFKVIDPEGFRLGDATVGTACNGPINFKINDGGTDFAVGDRFTITVSAGSGKYKVVNSASTDGSQDADCVLADDTDTAGGDVVAVAYASGLFNRSALIFGGEDTATQHEKRLRELGIFLKDNVPY